MKTPQKVSDNVLVESYKRLKSVWKVANEVGMSGQRIYERLKRMGIIKPRNILNDADKQRIRGVYEKGFEAGDGTIERLAKELGRTRQFICRYAGQNGLTKKSRKRGEREREKFPERYRDMWKRHPHPRGMTGKHHTEKTRERIAVTSMERWDKMTISERDSFVKKQLKTKLAKYGTLAPERHGTTWKAGWREIGGVRKYYRSKWEANYARFLEFERQHGIIKSWRHEPTTFWFEKIRRGCRSYLPDFEVIQNNGQVEYHEVKGWYDSRSKTKTKRMAKYYPDVKLRIIFEKHYKAIERQTARIIPGWE